MFVQVITGYVTDPAGFRREVDRWEDEVRPGASGFLGSTGGITPDGRFFVAARFASEDDARRNSDRAEQGAWWSAMEKTVRDVEFHDSVDVKLQGSGGSDSAGFVQVMRGQVKDAGELAKLEARMDEFDAAMKTSRPDVTGSVIVQHGDSTYTNIVYFTSESDARAAEGATPSAEVQALFAQMEAAITIDEYIDLPEPLLR